MFSMTRGVLDRGEVTVDELSSVTNAGKIISESSSSPLSRSSFAATVKILGDGRVVVGVVITLRVVVVVVVLLVVVLAMNAGMIGA